jgi:hypothetical protein
MKDETPLAGGAPPNTNRPETNTSFRTGWQFTTDERAPLWRGHWPMTRKKLRAMYGAYIDEFERYVAERRAA